jgi:sec-independent protein translocase protein TatA
MPGKFGIQEILIVALILVLLFGSKKLPEAARSIGRSMRIFRSEVKGMNNDQPAADTDTKPQP